MKTKRLILGAAFFVVGLVVTFGSGSNSRHHHFNHLDSVRKSAVIEVGAPLTVAQLVHEGFI